MNNYSLICDFGEQCSPKRQNRKSSYNYLPELGITSMIAEFVSVQRRYCFVRSWWRLRRHHERKRRLLAISRDCLQQTGHFDGRRGGFKAFVARFGAGTLPASGHLRLMGGG
jgi:membrane protein DedA with SNARE-associated domain